MSDMQGLESQGNWPGKYILDDVIFGMELGQIDSSAFSTRWVIISPRRSIFVINKNNDSAHNKHVVDTLVAMLPMFALYHKVKTPMASLVVLDTSDGDQGEKAGLAFCGNCSDIYLIPDRDFLRSKGYIETRRAYQENFIPWHARESIAFWRGSSTGWPLKKDNLCSIQRIMLCEMALSSPHSHFYDVGLSGIVQMTDEQKEQILGLNIVKNFVDSKEWIKYKESPALIARCRALVRSLGLEGAVEWHTDYLPDEGSLALLGHCDLIVLPYRDTQEAASGAVRIAMASRVPVLVTPVEIFDELGDAVIRTHGLDVLALASGIAVKLREQKQRDRTVDEADRWLEAHDWARMSERLYGMICGLVENQDVLARAAVAATSVGPAECSAADDNQKSHAAEAGAREPQDGLLVPISAIADVTGSANGGDAPTVGRQRKCRRREVQAVME